VLAIETSCDETAVAILAGDALLASEIASQTALHEPYGGVVPEVASRLHLTALQPLIRRALDAARLEIGEIDAFAATTGPGLATSLMVGVSTAKTLAIARQRPFVAVNHLEGHLLSPFLAASRPIAPSIGLVVSGGHTLLVRIEAFGVYVLLGRTQDDAAGEAFDKVGKLLGLPYPGGPEIDRLAREGDPSKYAFPRSMARGLDFSFSGLKTAVRYALPGLPDARLADLCASFQEAVVDVLVRKTVAAAKENGLGAVAMSGGVSCNSRLRERMAAACAQERLELVLAEPGLCTDNAAMIAYVARERHACGLHSSVLDDIDPNLALEAGKHASCFP
jgi:N6-L-threonylcarbamoyladenine synthase